MPDLEVPLWGHRRLLGPQMFFIEAYCRHYLPYSHVEIGIVKVHVIFWGKRHLAPLYGTIGRYLPYDTYLLPHTKKTKKELRQAHAFSPTAKIGKPRYYSTIPHIKKLLLLY